MATLLWSPDTLASASASGRRRRRRRRPDPAGRPGIAEELGQSQDGWRRTVALAATRGIPVPGFASALAYCDTVRRDRLPAALVQGLRDFFGAHSRSGGHSDRPMPGPGLVVAVDSGTTGVNAADASAVVGEMTAKTGAAGQPVTGIVFSGRSAAWARRSPGGQWPGCGPPATGWRCTSAPAHPSTRWRRW
jgi:6-phosphogluconate dehydrogenase, C-terminal domain